MSQILIERGGRISLPDDLMSALRLGAGDRVVYELCDEGVSIRRVPTSNVGARLQNPTPTLPLKNGIR